MDLKNVEQVARSASFKKVIYTLGAMVILLSVFQAGIFIGYHKAEFSFRGGENYYKAFGGPRGAMPFGMMNGNFPDSHGATGRVVSIALPILIIADRDGVEKTVSVTDDTEVRRFRNDVEPADIAVGDYAVILGEPNKDSLIEAKLIRLLPPPPDAPAPTARATTSTN